MMFQGRSLILSMLVLAGTTCCSTTAFTPETLLTKNNNRLSQVRLDNSVYNYNNDATATTPATTTAPLLSLAVQQQKDQRSLPSLVLQVETLQIRVVEEGETSSSSSSSTLPPILQDMANERKNFQMNLGKAMDTLRKDMPEILKTAPGKFIFF